ncbi:GNAT family N-acetyltransferase [Myxococcota bacterium]|nr:GNAT family N-acetyltransferase [Myxococcota bacterium]
MHLYRHYPDNFFDPAQLGTGLYFGVREEGELVSVAGVHVVSATYDVAVIGNIVTHSEHRGRGLATRCVARVLSALFGQVTHVALNVQATNVPALACYRRFGFTEQSKCLEGWVQVR